MVVVVVVVFNKLLSFLRVVGSTFFLIQITSIAIVSFKLLSFRIVKK